MIESYREFVITEALTHSLGHGAAYQCSVPSVIPLSYPGAPYQSTLIVGPNGSYLQRLPNRTVLRWLLLKIIMEIEDVVGKVHYLYNLK